MGLNSRVRARVIRVSKPPELPSKAQPVVWQAVGGSLP